jgi:very-short-patch-repair endonuclease
VELLLSQEGVLARRQHPKLASTLDWMLRRGELRSVLPGVYAAAPEAASLPARLAALPLWDPDAVLIGASAAQQSFWPSLRADPVTCAVKHHRPSQPGFVFVRRTVPAELVVERAGLRRTRPALTALDLCASRGGEGIDQVLRARAATLRQLHHALGLTGGRRGNRQRRALLLESRDEPWSEAERRFHVLLREAGITGWRANRPVLVDGAPYYLDVCFERLRLAIEIDGREHHSDAAAFENDRSRQNRLVLEGWRVLRFTWQMLVDEPEQVLAIVRAALALAEAA